MKLTCDLCGGGLQMNSDGQGAACTHCGLAYSMESLRKKLSSFSKPAVPAHEIPEEDIIYDVTDYEETVPESEATVRTLHILRKFSTVIFKAAVYLDGEQCAILGKSGSVTDIPVSRGEHEIFFRVATAAGMDETDRLTFRVGDRDWNGVFYLQRTAFHAVWKFEMQETP